MTQFTLGWKIAIIVAILASLTAIDRQKKAKLQYEQRLGEIEKSLKEIVEHAPLVEKAK